MIEVVYTRTGDRAEADSPEAVMFAAQTLARDLDSGIQGSTAKPSDRIAFYADGVLIREVVWGEIR